MSNCIITNGFGNSLYYKIGDSVQYNVFEHSQILSNSFVTIDDRVNNMSLHFVSGKDGQVAHIKEHAHHIGAYPDNSYTECLSKLPYTHYVYACTFEPYNHHIALMDKSTYAGLKFTNFFINKTLVIPASQTYTSYPIPNIKVYPKWNTETRVYDILTSDI